MVGYPTCIYENYISQLHIPFKKHDRAFLCNFLKKLKTSRDKCLGPQNPIHNPCDTKTHFAWIPYDHTPVTHSTGSYLE